MKLLGYKYNPVEAFVKVNPNKKVHGIKKPNKLDATSISRALPILRSTKITRKFCMTLLAEFAFEVKRALGDKDWEFG